MADISELILQVKNADSAVKEIDKVDKKLKQTAISSEKLSTLGKTIFAGWTFTKFIALAKKMGDAYGSALVTTRKFEAVFGSFNRNAVNGVKVLVDRFHDTNRAAKDLMATIGSRLDFGFDDMTLGKVSADLSRISKELASFYGKSVTDVSLKLTQSLGGQTRGLKEYGINIDVNSDKFKHLSSEIQKATGVTEKAATALAVYSGILEKTKDKEGTFETQAKSISQYLEDIKNAFVDGPLAKAGEILSKLFGPLFNFLNWFIKNPIGETLLSLASAAVTIRGSFMLLQLSLTGIVSLLAGSALGNISSKVHNFFQILLNGFTSGNFRLNRVTITFRILMQRFGKDLANNILIPVTRGFLWLGVQILRPIRAFFGLFSNQIFLSFQKVQLNLIRAFEFLGKGFSGKSIPYVGLIFQTLGSALAVGAVLLADEVGRYYSSTWKKVSDKVWGQISDFYESVLNFFTGNGFKTNKETLDDLSRPWIEGIYKRKEFLDKLDESVKELVEKFKSESSRDELILPDNPFETLEEYYDNFLKTKKDASDLEKKAKEASLNYQIEFMKFEGLKYQLADDYAEMMKAMRDGTLDMQDIFLENSRLAINAANVIEKESKLLASEASKKESLVDLQRKVQESQEFLKTFNKIQQALMKKLEDDTWYQGTLDKISSAINGFTPKEKVKSLEEKIARFREVYAKMIFSPEEAKEKYKEMSELEVQKFEAEMEALNTEREFIMSTNEMIKSYLDKALEWKAQGVDAIDVGTAEGYKFMTSGFSSLANIGPILKDQRDEERASQEKANSIAEGTKNILEGIKKKMDRIDPTAIGVKLEIVN